MRINKKPTGNKALRVIRNVYLYLVAMIGLVVLIIGSIGMINNVLQNYVFQVDQYSYYRSPLGYDVCNSVPNTLEKTDEVQKPTEQEIAECEAKYDEYNKKESQNQAKKDFAISIAQILVGLPLWLLHWGIIQREYRRRKKDDKK